MRGVIDEVVYNQFHTATSFVYKSKPIEIFTAEDNTRAAVEVFVWSIVRNLYLSLGVF